MVEYSFQTSTGEGKKDLHHAKQMLFCQVSQEETPKTQKTWRMSLVIAVFRYRTWLRKGNRVFYSSREKKEKTSYYARDILLGLIVKLVGAEVN